MSVVALFCLSLTHFRTHVNNRYKVLGLAQGFDFTTIHSEVGERERERERGEHTIKHGIGDGSTWDDRPSIGVLVKRLALGHVLNN